MGGETIDWQRAHEELLRIAHEQAALDLDEGQWLLAALRLGTHVRLGFGSFIEYSERLFGYGPRLTQEKLRVAEALEELPEMIEALRAGEICWSAARELTRVATPTTEREWLDGPAVERFGTSNDWCPGIAPAIDRTTPLIAKRGVTC